MGIHEELNLATWSSPDIKACTGLQFLGMYHCFSCSLEDHACSILNGRKGTMPSSKPSIWVPSDLCQFTVSSSALLCPSYLICSDISSSHQIAKLSVQIINLQHCSPRRLWHAATELNMPGPSCWQHVSLQQIWVLYPVNILQDGAFVL